MTRLTKTEVAAIHGGFGALDAVAYMAIAVSVPVTIKTLFECAKWCGNNRRLHTVIAAAAGFVSVLAVYFAYTDK